MKFTFCGKCGAKMNINDTFCSNCGTGNQQINYQTTNNQRLKSPVNTTLAILLTALVLLSSVALGFVIYSGGSEKDEPAPSEQITKTPQPFVNNTPEYQTRIDLYNPNLVYKRMNGIHNTSLTDDYTYSQIADVIYQFEKECEDYMNGRTNVVPMTLRRGTTAYNQQVDYKKNHPTLTQYYENINIINTRQGGGYYYAWVEETLRVTEKGAEKVVTDRWVYKLSNTNGVWYIDDYTRDPSF